MFHGFNLIVPKEDTFLHSYQYKSSGNKYFEGQEKQLKLFQETFTQYVTEGRLDGDVIQKEWFRSVNANVFISHSHQDEALAIALAGFLHKEFKLHPFVDSKIWGYSENLLNNLVNKYGNHMTGCYCGYRKDNEYCNLMKRYASHVYMMLTTALVDMMDKCECLFFLNTQKSCNASQISGMEETLSPWIYMEMSLSRTIRRKKLEPDHDKRCKYIAAGVTGRGSIVENVVDISHSLDLDHLDQLTSSDLQQWLNTRKDHGTKFPLDALYRQQEIFQKRQTNDEL